MSSWIKFEKSLESDPRVLRVAKALANRFTVFDNDDPSHGATFDPCNACAFQYVTLGCGALARLWIYADSHCRDDDTLDMSAAEVDEWLGLPGFCSMLPADWLVELEGGRVELPGFQTHNGVEARKLALTQKRVARHRNAAALQTQKQRNAPALPDQTRPDQTRPEKKVPSEPMPRASFDAAAVAGLNQAAWAQWVAYRTAIKKPLKAPSLAAAAKQMAKLGDQQAAAVEHSIANQYQGLIPPKAMPGTVTQLTRYERNRQGLYDDQPPADADNFLLTGSTR